MPSPSNMELAPNSNESIQKRAERFSQALGLCGNEYLQLKRMHTVIVLSLLSWSLLATPAPARSPSHSSDSYRRSPSSSQPSRQRSSSSSTTRSAPRSGRGSLVHRPSSSRSKKGSSVSVSKTSSTSTITNAKSTLEKAKVPSETTTDLRNTPRSQRRSKEVNTGYTAQESHTSPNMAPKVTSLSIIENKKTDTGSSSIQKRYSSLKTSSLEVRPGQASPAPMSNTPISSTKHRIDRRKMSSTRPHSSMKAVRSSSKKESNPDVAVPISRLQSSVTSGSLTEETFSKTNVIKRNNVSPSSTAKPSIMSGTRSPIAPIARSESSQKVSAKLLRKDTKSSTHTTAASTKTSTISENSRYPILTTSGKTKQKDLHTEAKSVPQTSVDSSTEQSNAFYKRKSGRRIGGRADSEKRNQRYTNAENRSAVTTPTSTSPATQRHNTKRRVSRRVDYNPGYCCYDLPIYFPTRNIGSFYYYDDYAPPLHADEAYPPYRRIVAPNRPLATSTASLPSDKTCTVDLPSENEAVDVLVDPQKGIYVQGYVTSRDLKKCDFTVTYSSSNGDVLVAKSFHI
ncbi:unnamed protein product [Pseudo-nitzschia multistriata]|uniref:Uncharacterized protein n=1 Tax=Pseudo-nitzschia multistriata TaxID=183589 RepID=A0A448YYY3_9STRA|nr:unnamed protein product [Pseudo-nitzschia multistriata]